MTNETLEPGEFVLESWPRLRVSIGQVDRRDQNTLHRGLDVAALGILPIARQLVSGQLWFADVRKYRHAIICWLATPDRGVPHRVYGDGWEAIVRGLEFLVTAQVLAGVE